MSNSTLPNPDVYLNHLSPNEARQFEIGRDLYIAVTGVSFPFGDYFFLLCLNWKKRFLFLWRSLHVTSSRLYPRISESSNDQVGLSLEPASF